MTASEEGLLSAIGGFMARKWGGKSISPETRDGLHTGDAAVAKRLFRVSSIRTYKLKNLKFSVHQFVAWYFSAE